MQLLAHVKWFVDSEGLPDVDPLTLIEYISVLMFAAMGLWVLWRLNEIVSEKGIHQYIDKKLRRFGEFVPAIVRYTTAALLLLNAWYNYILAPNLTYSGNDGEIFIATTFVLSGMMLLVGGIFIRPAAMLMLVGYGSTYVFANATDAFEHLEYVGIALYLFLAGETHSILPSLRAHTPKFVKQYSKHAVRLLSIFVGVGLSVLAFSEKLFAMDVAQDFLNNHDWNILSSIGVSDRNFIILAGAMELLVGLSLIFNVATRISTLMLLGIMTITALLLGADEVVGHLFAVGVVAAIWIPQKVVNK